MHLFIYIHIDVCLGKQRYQHQMSTHVYDLSNPLRGPQPFPCWILLEVDLHLLQQDL